MNVLILGGEASGDAEMGLGTASFKDIGHHLSIAVWRLYKQLGLFFGVGSLLQLFEDFDAIIGLYGKVSVESKALTIESGSHYSQDYAGGTDQRYYLQSFALCYCHYIGTGICYSGTSGLRNHSHWITLLQRFQQTCNLFRIGMLVKRIKGELVNIYAAVHKLEKTAGSAYILHNEMADAQYYLMVIGRKNLVNRSLTQKIGNKV